MTAPVKRGRGRPPLPAADRRSAQIRLPVTAGELAALRAAAVRDDADLTAWIREGALRRARRVAR